MTIDNLEVRGLIEAQNLHAQSLDGRLNLGIIEIISPSNLREPTSITVKTGEIINGREFLNASQKPLENKTFTMKPGSFRLIHRDSNNTFTYIYGKNLNS